MVIDTCGPYSAASRSITFSTISVKDPIGSSPIPTVAWNRLNVGPPGTDPLRPAVPPRIIGEHEAQGLSRQHRLVDRADLVRERIHVRRVDRHHRVEEVRELDARGFGGELEVRGRGVERELRFGSDLV